MLVIRLQRTGRENTPTYRIVVSEKARHAKTGTLEILGHYLPSREQPVFECKQERVSYWISKGAQPSDTMARLLRRAGMEKMDKYIKRYAKQKSKSEVAAAPVTPPAEAPSMPKDKEPVGEKTPEPEKKEEAASVAEKTPEPAKA